MPVANLRPVPREEKRPSGESLFSALLWSGRRDSNPRPQPWQSDLSLRWGRLEPHKSCSGHCEVRSRPPQSLHPAAVDVTIDVTKRADAANG